MEWIPILGTLLDLWSAYTAEPNWLRFFVVLSYTIGGANLLLVTIGPMLVSLTETKRDDALLAQVVKITGLMLVLLSKAASLNPKLSGKMATLADQRDRVVREWHREPTPGP